VAPIANTPRKIQSVRYRGSRAICRANTLAMNRAIASPTAFGASSCKKCKSGTVATCWFGQAL
jgi:hypothetical protein